MIVVVLVCVVDIVMDFLLEWKLFLFMVVIWVFEEEI